MRRTPFAMCARGRHGVVSAALVLIFAGAPAAGLQAPVPGADPPDAASPQPGIEEAPATPPGAVPAGMDVERLDRLHPLSPLTADQFLSGLAQTVLLARNYGTTFSSGALSFGGGDSQDLLRELLEKSEGI